MKAITTLFFLSLFSFSVSLADDVPVPPSKVSIADVVASSPEDRAETRKAADGNFSTRWSSQPTDSEWITFTLRQETVIDRIIICWEAAFGETYQVQVSKDASDWFVVYNAVKHKGGKEVIDFKPVLAKFVRIFGIARGTQWGYSIFETEIYSTDKEPVPLTEFPRPEDIKYAKSDLTPLAYFYRAAQISSPGLYPPWLYKKQAYWTITGAAYARQESLFSEDATVDSYKGGFSLAPYLYIENRLITAQDLDGITQSLEDGYLPIPTVAWQYKKIDLVQKLFSYGAEKESYTCVLYTLQNTGEETIEGKLFLAIRPFQVNPPWMYGGFAKLQSIKRRDNIIEINGQPRISALNKPDKFGAVRYEEGDIIDKIKVSELPQAQEIECPANFASGAFEYQFKLFGGQREDYFFVISLGDNPSASSVKSSQEIMAKLNEVEVGWARELNKLEIDIPDKYMVDVFKSNLAYIMINYDDSAFIPGPRNYERSWIRDGSEMAVALLRCGQYEMVKKYIRWLVGHQRPTGEIPPIIDTDGKMHGEKEYDNQGEFLFTVSQYYHFTRDKKFLKEIFPSLLKAAKFIETLRNQRLTAGYKDTRFYGILPTSISHEGFASPGAHSYWDDWWALKGLKDMIYISAQLGKEEEVKWLSESENGLRKHLLSSIQLTMKQKRIPFIPSSAEGHIDACGDAIAVWPTEENSYLPQGAMLALLDSWYNNVFIPERKKVIKNNFTPYEMRMISAYLLLEQREKALDMLRFFLSVTRPKGWNQWAECVTKTYREPTYLGDLPHGWVAAMYINAIRNMFACEYNDSLLLGLGIDEKWFERESGIGIKNFPTHYGELSYTIKKTGDNLLEIKISELRNMPKGGIIFNSPLSLPIKSVTYNDKEWNRYLKDKIFIVKLPAVILVDYHPEIFAQAANRE